MSSLFRRSRRTGGGRLFARAAALSGLLLTPAAHAYIDPGTGSLILQGLIAAVAGVSVTAGIYWDRIKAFLRRHRKDPNDNTGNHGQGVNGDDVKRTRDDD